MKRSLAIALGLLIAVPGWLRAEPFASLKPAHTREGYLARLLINEAPFPGERGWQSASDTKATMLAILWVLHSRLHYIPNGYRQVQIAAVRTDDIIDVITVGGEKGQCDGFYRDTSGQFKAVDRVHKRVAYLLKIANSGNAPGRFAGLMNYAQGLAAAYISDGIGGADRFAGLSDVHRTAVTGRAYSWMSDFDYYNPGGNFVSIPDADRGATGGNRFFTLRKDPK